MKTFARAPRIAVMGAVLAATMLALAGCAPGASNAPTQQSGDVSTTLTSKNGTIKIQDDTGFPVTSKLADEFTNQHPNVKFKIVRESFQNLLANSTRLMASANAPDL